MCSRKGRLRPSVLTHGHEDHIGAVPYVVPHVGGPIYGTPLTLALVEPKLTEHGIDVQGARLTELRPPGRARVGPFEIEFIRVTHSMPDCVARGDTHAGRRGAPHRRFQNRSDADRRAASRRASIRRTWFGGRPGALCRQHECRSPRLHRLRARRRRGFRRDLRQHDRPSDRGRVLIQHLPDADSCRSGGAVRPKGGLCRARHDRKLPDCAAPRVSANSGWRPDPRFGGCRTIRPKTCCALQPVLKARQLPRCRGSPSTIIVT